MRVMHYEDQEILLPRMLSTSNIVSVSVLSIPFVPQRTRVGSVLTSPAADAMQGYMVVTFESSYTETEINAICASLNTEMGLCCCCPKYTFQIN